MTSLQKKPPSNSPALKNRPSVLASRLPAFTRPIQAPRCLPEHFDMVPARRSKGVGTQEHRHARRTFCSEAADKGPSANGRQIRCFTQSRVSIPDSDDNEGHTCSWLSLSEFVADTAWLGHEFQTCSQTSSKDYHERGTWPVLVYRWYLRYCTHLRSLQCPPQILSCKPTKLWNHKAELDT